MLSGTRFRVHSSFRARQHNEAQNAVGAGFTAAAATMTKKDSRPDLFPVSQLKQQRVESSRRRRRAREKESERAREREIRNGEQEREGGRGEREDQVGTRHILRERHHSFRVAGDFFFPFGSLKLTFFMLVPRHALPQYHAERFLHTRIRVTHTAESTHALTTDTQNVVAVATYLCVLFGR